MGSSIAESRQAQPKRFMGPDSILTHSRCLAVTEVIIACRVNDGEKTAEAVTSISP